MSDLDASFDALRRAAEDRATHQGLTARVDEADALAQLRPNVDGVIFTASGRRSTFLPQVWEQLPEPREFMARLKQKAGLAASYWGPDVRLERYTVHKWKEAAQ